MTDTIPNTLEEALHALDDLLGDEDKAFVDEADTPKAMIGFHHNLGRHLRNEWGLWHGSELKTRLQHRYGTSEADELSGQLLEDYWRHRHQEGPMPTAWDHIRESV